LHKIPVLTINFINVGITVVADLKCLNFGKAQNLILHSNLDLVLAAINYTDCCTLGYYAISNFVLSKITLKLISAFSALNTRIIISIVALFALFSSFEI